MTKLKIRRKCIIIYKSKILKIIGFTNIIISDELNNLITKFILYYSVLLLLLFMTLNCLHSYLRTIKELIDVIKPFENGDTLPLGYTKLLYFV